MSYTRYTRCSRLPVACLVAASFGIVLIAQTDQLTDVLRRAGEFSLRFARDAAVVLADEACRQSEFRLRREPGLREDNVTRVGRQSWRAEVAWVRTPELENEGLPWVELRDIFEVPRTTTADRKPRLASLFLLKTERRLDEARRMTQESARFNIGPVRRNWNVSAVPLLVLHPVNAGRFAFEKAGEERIDGKRAWKVEYREQTTPMLIRLEDGANTPSWGEIWIDPASGEVLRSVLRCGQSTTWAGRLTVTYNRDARLGLRVPGEMSERFELADGRWWVEGSCTYSNFRRFETGGRLILQK